MQQGSKDGWEWSGRVWADEGGTGELTESGGQVKGKLGSDFAVLRCIPAAPVGEELRRRRSLGVTIRHGYSIAVMDHEDKCAMWEYSVRCRSTVTMPFDGLRRSVVSTLTITLLSVVKLH